MSTVELRDKEFCQGCKKRKLQIYQETHYSEDGTRKQCDFAQCEHLPVCMHLAERLSERYEQEIESLAEDRDYYMDMYHDAVEDSYDDDYDNVLDDDDYSFCDDATWEDRQL